MNRTDDLFLQQLRRDILLMSKDELADIIIKLTKERNEILNKKEEL